MKKTFLIILIFALLLTLVSCQNEVIGYTHMIHQQLTDEMVVAVNTGKTIEFISTQLIPHM